MKPLLIALVFLCASPASAQWMFNYTPIEQSHSYRAALNPYYGGGYYGPVYPRIQYGGYGAPGPQPLRLHYMQSSRGTVYQGFSY